MSQAPSYSADIGISCDRIQDSLYEQDFYMTRIYSFEDSTQSV